MCMQTILRDGLRISKLTLGTVQLGMPYGIANRSGMPDEQASFQILDEALSGGVVSFDTAQAYGQSEAVLGRYLSGRRDCTVITKIVLDLEASASASELECKMTGQVEASLDRLKIGKIPILMLHHASDLLKFGTKLADACGSLVRNGYVRKIGASFGADRELQTREIWTYAKHSVFEAVQVPINLLDHRIKRSGLLQEMGEAGKIVFARSIFLQGLMFLKPSQMPENLKAAVSYINQLQRCADREGLSLAELAVAFVRDMPHVHSLVIGAETPGQAKTNIDWMQVPPIADNTRCELEKRMADVPELVISPQLWSK